MIIIALNNVIPPANNSISHPYIINQCTQAMSVEERTFPHSNNNTTHPPPERTPHHRRHHLPHICHHFNHPDNLPQVNGNDSHIHSELHVKRRKGDLDHKNRECKKVWSLRESKFLLEKIFRVFYIFHLTRTLYTIQGINLFRSLGGRWIGLACHWGYRILKYCVI